MNEIEIARATVLEHVLAERERQDAIWGDQRDNTDERWAVIALEELGEVAKDIYETKLGSAYTEIIQVAAVMVAWAESLRRRGVMKNYD